MSRPLLPFASAMVSAYLGGQTCAQVARQYGVSDETVRRYVIASGAKIRTSASHLRGRRPPGQPTADETVVTVLATDVAHDHHVNAVASALGGRGFPFYDLRRAA